LRKGESAMGKSAKKICVGVIRKKIRSGRNCKLISEEGKGISNRFEERKDRDWLIQSKEETFSPLRNAKGEVLESPHSKA